MKVWTTDEFTGHYPVGIAAIVVAETAEEAAIALNELLIEQKLPGDAGAAGMKLLNTRKKSVLILCDGDY